MGTVAMSSRPPRGVFVPHLREWRSFRALTQNQLAHKARIAISTVIRAERGLNINGGSARKLAEALGIPVEDLHHPPLLS